MKRILAVLAAAALVVSGCSSAGGGTRTSTSAKPAALNDQIGNTGPYAGIPQDPPRPRPVFTLTDTKGKPYSFSANTSGKTTLVYFGYTRCPDICPATMADIGVALRQLPAAVASKVTVVFVSTDVKHDTGPVIAKWLSSFSPKTHATWVGLRGTKPQVDAAQAAAHVFLAEDGGAQHSTQVLLYSPDNYSHVSYVYNGSGERQQIEHDLRYVVTGQS